VDVEMLGRTRTVWLDRHLSDQGIVVLLHSGAYVSGPFTGDWEWLSRQVDTRRCAGLLVDYRVAPDHHHPVALDDTLAALDDLAAQDRLGPYVLSGINAGAGVALSAACRLRDRESTTDAAPLAPVPSGLVLMSPWADLELANTGMTETGQRDFVHERRMLKVAAQAYAGRTPLDDPILSPVNAPLRGLPPVHLSVGTKDIFLTDTRVLRLQFEQSELDVAYREVAGRLSTVPWWSKGEDAGRLMREQAEGIRNALNPR
jgi:acetyl esterase/lipase